MRPTCVSVLVLSLSFPLCASSADYADRFARANPAVVVLYTTQRVAAPGGRVGEVAADGLGSGFLIDDDGHVITAAHVIQTADLVEAEFADGSRSTAAIIASDPLKDVALLKLDTPPKGVRPLKLANSDDVRIGEEVFVIGAPYGLSHTLSIGHISARHRGSSDLMGDIVAETFQTDAAINQGNSGGPLFNAEGQVIGVVSHIRSQSGGSEGLGFAVTSNEAYDALFKHRMAWSGLSGMIIAGPLARALNLPQAAGYLVQNVAKNSPAARLGLQPSRVPVVIAGNELLIGGDIILAIDDIQIAPGMQQAFRDKLAALVSGSVVTLTVLRAGSVIRLAAPVG